MRVVERLVAVKLFWPEGPGTSVEHVEGRRLDAAARHGKCIVDTAVVTQVWSEKVKVYV